MYRTIKILSAVLIVLAMLIAVYAWRLANKTSKPAQHGEATLAYQAVVATRPIASGETLTSELLTVAPVAAQTAGSFQSTPDLVGRVVIMPVAAGAPLLENELNAGLAARVAQGERAVAIRIDEQSGVGNRIRPGDFVDVFVLLRRDGTEIDRSAARLLLPRLRVLSFGSASIDTTDASTPKAQEVIRTAVLAVPVDQIAQLALGDTAGKLTLALRNPADMAAPEARTLLVHGYGNTTLAANSDPSSRAEVGVVLADLADANSASPPAKVPAKSAAALKAGSSSKTGVQILRAGKIETFAY